MSISGITKLLPYAAAALLGAQAVSFAARPTDDLLRPPGAQDEKDFASKCIKCGRCIQACPYAALVPAGPNTGSAVGSPTLDVREQACRLCTDFPCIEACPTEALCAVEAIEDVNMGYAVIDEELCIALAGMRCEVCYRACPLIDRAITIDYRLREGDSIHSIFAPVIDQEACVGCGLCVERCVVSEPEVAIKIVRQDPERS
ncbi:4Fe-4S dicluster domain-containing protein [Raoultibacter phocaeensis]|uniref:4Fe-4S dicluster domain-containing protein n=1 Tax=Raoultibacter phocaeensis TaxID=2479841 RepID=UPI001119844F|nr:4Fe-4S dicluster domain-containing protein [Raoultibacter phocaeensis]